MGLFNRSRQKAPSYKEIKELKAESQKHALDILGKTLDSLESRMKSNRSFSEELYPTGIKQGPNAGILNHRNDITRKLSRMVHVESPVAAALVSTLSTLTIGHGLDYESQPLWRLIPGATAWTTEQRSEWMKGIENSYHIWAKRKSVSYENDENRYQQEQRIFKSLLIDGEYFEIYRYASTANKNPLSIQIIKPEDVRQPLGSKCADGNSEEDGIEYNAKGQAVAYHVYNHANSKTVRVARVGARSGRTFVNHVKLGNNRRGYGILADIITELTKLGDYEVLELQAAVVNALYAIWVETPDGEDGVPVLNSGGISNQKNQPSQSTISAEDWVAERKELSYNEGGLQLDALPGGYKVNSHDTKRPNVNFGNFMDQVKKNLFAARALPLSVIDKQFANNYSASRAELILAWYEVDRYRFNQASTNDLVLKMWMWGEVASGRVSAPGFLESEDIRDAWVNSKWIGPQRPDIDPKRSVEAHAIEQDRGYRTGKQITAERGGGDYDENLTRVAEEKQKLSEMAVIPSVDNNGDEPGV